MNDSSPSSSNGGPNLAAALFHSAYPRFILFGLLIATLPLFSGLGLMKSSTLNYIGNVLVYAVAALGLNLLLGYSGLISLGTAGFMGLGSYIAAYVSKDMGMSFWAALATAVLIPTLIGLLIGLISLRIEGIYLAIATLCVSEILLKSFEQADSITGGMQGKSVSYPVLFGHAFNRSSTYLMLVVVLTLVMMLTHSFVNGQKGRALHAMRGSEVAAQAMGVNLLQYRLIAFSLATAYSALSGVLYVYFVKFSYPSVWNLNLSLYVLAAVVIGGLRSIYGTVVGTFVVWAVPDLILKKLPVVGAINGLPYIFNGLLIIVVIMFAPQGISGLWLSIPAMKKKKLPPAGKEAV
ncbi:MAG: branched-chain amino acid ABC transporter permease [Synergistaceae bacterium]|jgi:branched-chain amino acid transport system permease protein|nr:branched-chain amino acid ABC transporter permease [Synergistaceae bacterium]